MAAFRSDAKWSPMSMILTIIPRPIFANFGDVETVFHNKFDDIQARSDKGIPPNLLDAPSFISCCRKFPHRVNVSDGDRCFRQVVCRMGKIGGF